MERAFGKFIEEAVTAAADKAIPTSVNHAFITAVDQAVKEKAEEIEKIMEKKLDRAIRKNELEANLDAVNFVTSKSNFFLSLKRALTYAMLGDLYDWTTLSCDRRPVPLPSPTR